MSRQLVNPQMTAKVTFHENPLKVKPPLTLKANANFNYNYSSTSLVITIFPKKFLYMVLNWLYFELNNQSKSNLK